MKRQTNHRFGRNPFGLAWAAAALATALFLPAMTYGGGVVTNATEAALNSALSGGGTVTFACNGVINLSGTKTISTNTVLNATGYGITLSGQGSVQLFVVNSGVSLTLVNLTLANGKTTGNGGAINNSGTLTANYCTFTNNTALGANGTPGQGGNNNGNGNGGSGSGGGAGGSVGGGAIYNAGSVALTNCVFEYNSAVGGAGGNGGAGGTGSFDGGNGGNGGAGGTAHGGAIYSTNSVSVMNCTFGVNTTKGGNGGAGGAGGTGDYANGDNGSGGLGEGSGAGMYAQGSSTVNGCTFYSGTATGGNTAASGEGSNGWGIDGQSGANSFGGGVCNVGSEVIVNSTFYSNGATGGNGGDGGPTATWGGGDGGAGGNGLGGGLYNSSTVHVTNCTFSTNGVYGGAGGAGGIGTTGNGNSGGAGSALGANIANGSGTFSLKNSIIAYKANNLNGYGTVTDYGNNISSDTSITLNGSGSHSNTDPKLSSLANNGGFTPTCALLSGSPAINAGDDTAAPFFDQRGYVRVGTSDIGAYEYGGFYDFPTVEIVTTNSTATDGESVSAFRIYQDTYFTNGPAETIYYAISGTASNGVDFTPTLTNSAVIPAGQDFVLVPITPAYRTNVVGTKQLTLTLQSGATYTVGTNSSATLGLLDDVPSINVTASVAYALGTNSPGQFSISRTGGTGHALTVNYVVNGTAQAGSGYIALPAAVTFVASQTSTNLPVTPAANPSTAQTVVLTLSSNADYFLGANAQAVVTLLPISSTTNSVASPAGRYWRGSGSDPTYWSIVVPLDYETGTLYDNVSGDCATLYPGLSSWTNSLLYHYDATNSLSQTNAANRIAFNNPIVAFGERVGGTPLYLNQDYRFGVYAGDLLSVLPVTITVFARSNYAVVGTINVYPPNFDSTNSWNAYTTNGFQVTTNAYGLTTTLSDSPSLTWGAASYGAYVLNHSASAQATNYYYLVQATGYPDGASSFMAITSSGGMAPSLLYTLEFEPRPAWRSVFIDQPHFDGSPLPPFYAGMTLAELLTNTPPVTNAVALAPSACTNLDDSPELRRHPVLDQFVSDMGNDPIALANYVLNEIDLTDAMDYNENGNVAEQSINLGGLSRGALGTFLEKQGSPTEQCALLIYLLRQAGVPACYIFPPHNGMKILDARLSRMLKFQVQGGFSEAGQLYTTNTMIAVNYPWVAAYTGTNWVHLFPWLKDYEINEGLDLYDYMPTNYSSAYPWVRDYVYGSTNLLSLAVDGDNTPRVILPAFLQQTLLQNYPGVSVDDLGVQIADRQHYYARWQDFLTPTWVTNTSTAVESLTASAITNVNPAMTNIFDTLSVEIYSVIDPTKDIQTGDLRLADLHNRKFYLTQSNSAPGFVQLSLVLAPYRTNITSQGSFGSSDPTFRQVLSMNLDQFDDQLTVRFKLLRHRALAPSYAIDPTLPFLEFGASRQIILERPLRKGDVAALCFNYGQVTRDMLNLWATDLWQMESALQANPSLTNSISADVYQGTTMYLCGMSYYEKESQFDAFNRNLHKINSLSSFAAGLSKISPNRDSAGNLAGGSVDPVLPNVDMFFYDVASVGNGTLRPDSGWTYELENQNCDLMAITDASAEEHQVLNRYYQQTNALSTVRMLQLAGTQGGGIVALNVNNYAAQGQTVYQGKALQAHDPGLWQQVVGAFQNAADAAYVTAYVTPGPITNSAYKGMAALVLSWGEWLALISPDGLNGGFAVNLPGGTIAPPATVNWNLSSADDLSLNLLPSAAPGGALVPAQVAPWEVLATDNQIQNYVIDPASATWAVNEGALMGLAPQNNLNQTYAQNFQASQEQGGFSWLSDAGAQALSKLADPVHSVTGEFFVDETDLALPGPMPLSLRRNYSSLNQADNQFGPGWKLSIMPYLSVGAGGTNIYAADMDGAVLAYVRTATNASVWLPTPAANPQLDNNTTAGVGGLVNRLRDRLVQTVNGSTTNYTLYGADGSVRAFQVMSFNSGSLNQTRPYLQQWTDSRGNYYTFAYGTNASQPDFGQARRIQCSNGNYLGFYFDIYGHIIEAYSGDGRRLLYGFDEFGDLVTVTLPDESTREYVYQHGTQAVTNGTVVTQQPYSTHLIVEADKPDGRALVNAYDSQRRVTNQLSTAGADLTPVRTASFVYANNFNLTNYYTNTISGYTLVIDGNNHTNRFDYTNGLITQITDPLGQTIQQTWYADNATAPGYPRSVSLRTDKRGLTTQFFYDSNGNVTNSIVTGDLTGDGIPTQTATNSAVYNANCLPLQTTDPAGNGTVFVYDSTFTFLPQQVIRYAGATPVSTNFIVYGSVTNSTAQGSTTQTNLARGLAVRQIRAYGSPDAATNDTAYNGQGFPIQTVRYTGTSDPAVTNSFFYNERGQRVDQLDGVGALTHFEYDAMDRPAEQWNVDEYGSLLSWSFNYYNDNGELTWSDGPAYNPEDYIWRDYDGAGRLSTEIHWRAEAKPDGSGVGVPPASNLYAQTFYAHDVLGNLTWSVNPRGVITTNTWDSLNRLVARSVIETNGAILTTESFGYEPGGLEHFHTNALGGYVQTEYTTNGLPKYRLNADGSTNGWRYYLDGRMRREIQRNGAYWETTYDDANRKATRIFYSSASVPLATNLTVLDRRGNVVQRVDAVFNVFTNLFDGLDRLKVAAGPAAAMVSQSCSGLPNCGVYVTNILQQVTTRIYDAANRVLVVSNALGEKTITSTDMLGRVLSVQTFAAGASSPLRVTTTSYSADHHGVTVTEGSGSEAVVTTTFTDNDGHCVLAIGYPSTGVSEYTLNQYDLAGNLVHEEHDSSSGPTVWTKADYAFDGLNRMVQKSDRDGAVTSFAYNAANNPTNRLMPGGLQWTAIYNNAGQELQDWVTGTNGATTMANSFTYYPSGNAAAGLLQTKTDGRGVTATCTYDSWLRLTNTVRSIGSPYGLLTTTWGYDVRGLATNISEMNYGDITDPGAKTVSRAFDAYGQMTSETITLNGTRFSSAGQGWDVAGRRTLLALSSQVAGLSYGYSWRADGLLGSVGTQLGNASYGYSTAGLLDTRAVGIRATTVASRDGMGRPLTIGTTVNTQQKLSETLSWTADGLLGTHVLGREDFTDERDYTYASLSRRLIEERVNLDAATRWTNDFVYDGGASSGLGLLTFAGGPSAGSAAWSGGVSPLGRINTETNTAQRQTAYGRFNGQATVSATLDGRPLPISINTTNDYAWTNRWLATMELTPGTHRLSASALHPSGLFTTNVSVWFTNNSAREASHIYRDFAGNITARIWTGPSGTTNRLQSLFWDGKGRLCILMDYDAQGNGFYKHPVYDGLDRLLYTVWYPVTGGGVSFLVTSQTNAFVYDPQVQFLDLGVYVGPSGQDSTPGQMTWKLCGPDLNGKYGGMNGAGGLEAVATGVQYFAPTISDARGNILATVNNQQSAINWLPSRPTGYGAVPGYRPLPLGHGGSYAQSAAWRGKWADVTGYIWLGARFYDPVAGMFISPDPVWNSQDPSYWSYCGGDPVNHVDSNGTCIEGAVSRAESWLSSNPSAYQVGLEWVTGLGPRDRTFGPGDTMFQQLLQTQYPNNGQALLLNQLNGSGPGDSYLPVQFGRDLGAEPKGAFYAGFVSDLYNNPTRAYLGSFNGQATISSVDYSQGTALLNYTAYNQSSLESATRLPPPYGYSDLSDGSARPSLTHIVSTWLPQTVSAAAGFPGNLVSDIWNSGSISAGWQGAVGQFQSSAPPIHTAGDLVPKSILPDNVFGVSGPFSTVSQTFQWQQTVQFQPKSSPPPNP